MDGSSSSYAAQCSPGSNGRDDAAGELFVQMPNVWVEDKGGDKWVIKNYEDATGGSAGFEDRKERGSGRHVNVNSANAKNNLNLKVIEGCGKEERESGRFRFNGAAQMSSAESILAKYGASVTNGNGNGIDFDKDLGPLEREFKASVAVSADLGKVTSDARMKNLKKKKYDSRVKRSKSSNNN